MLVGSRPPSSGVGGFRAPAARLRCSSSHSNRLRLLVRRDKVENMSRTRETLPCLALWRAHAQGAVLTRRTRRTRADYAIRCSLLLRCRRSRWDHLCGGGKDALRPNISKTGAL